MGARAEAGSRSILSAGPAVAVRRPCRLHVLPPLPLLLLLALVRDNVCLAAPQQSLRRGTAVILTQTRPEGPPSSNVAPMPDMDPPVDSVQVRFSKISLRCVWRDGISCG